MGTRAARHRVVRFIAHSGTEVDPRCVKNYVSLESRFPGVQRSVRVQRDSRLRDGATGSFDGMCREESSWPGYERRVIDGNHTLVVRLPTPALERGSASE